MSEVNDSEVTLLERIKQKLYGNTYENEPEVILPLSESISVRLATYDANQARRLSDGTLVRYGASMGRLDIAPTVRPDESLSQYVKRITSEVPEALHHLALLCQENEALRNVQVFGGYSHLSKIGKNYGFDLFKLDPEYREAFTKNASEERERAVGKNSTWKSLREKGLRSPQVMEALISRDSLILQFGEKHPEAA